VCSYLFAGGFKLEGVVANLAPKAQLACGSIGKMDHGRMMARLIRMISTQMWICRMMTRVLTGRALTMMGISHGDSKFRPLKRPGKAWVEITV